MATSIEQQDVQENSSRNPSKVSMLNMLEDRYRAQNQRTVLYRLIIVGKLNNKSKIDLGDYYDKLFKNMHNDMKASSFQEKVTGLIILYPTIMIHCVESSLDVIKMILNNMIDMMSTQENACPIVDAKILNISRDITRLFPIYLIKTMNFSLEYDSSEPNESSDVLLNETISRLLRLGKYFYDKSPIKKEQVDAVHEKHPELLPNQNYANYLLKYSTLLTPKEYLDYYRKPLDIILDSELTWPAPFKLFSYE